MKLLPSWAEAAVKPPVVLLALITILMIWASDVLAYDEYDAGCQNCHGGFLSSPYNPPSGGTSWSNSLHDTHQDMVSNDCNTCHTSGDRTPVFLESSSGGTGLATISCVGCHGRDEDNGNATTTGTSQRGAGLRQHHAGEASCGGCHDDQTGYTPVGEDVLPNYYASPGTGHPSIPSNSCNPSGGENFAGSATGLDNDGNGIYDAADSSCVTAVPTYSVGGNVSGLTVTGLQLQNNGTDTLSVAADGAFTFATELEDGSAYAVTVSSQPTGQTCSVSNGSGTVTADVTNVAVTCVTDVVPTYSIGGNVSGLTGTGLALQNNGTDTLSVTVDGAFTFTTELEDGSAYAVTVSSQPTGQSCSVSNASGTIATADVSNVAVTCVNVATYSVGGNVSGLTGTGLALQNNGTDTLSVTADGAFTFATELRDGSAYVVTVSSQPTGQSCTVSNGSGTVTADVTNVTVTCVFQATYSVGGNVSGLTGTGLILRNNGTDPLAVAADGPFTFATEVRDGSTYMVTVSSQPTGQTCTVSNGSGTATADVTDVALSCEDGVVVPPPSDAAIPTLSAWALFMLTMLLGLAAFINRRRLF